MSASQGAPPSYAQATGSSTASDKASATTQSNPSSKLEVPGEKNGIPSSARRSMEDERRPLPPGWVRQWDAKEKHQFFVNTKSDPPRSIWHHPHDDPEFLNTLSSEERERIQEQERNLKESPHLDLTDDEAPLPPRPDGRSSAPVAPGEKKTFGRKWKDKITGTTHEEREADRARKAEEERQYYEAHLRFREAMQRAQATGQPQFFAKDRDGKEIYIEPPQAYGGYGGGYGGYGGGYGYNPYSSGLYSNPNARFIRPTGPYGRPYGGGYGGGLGVPLAGGILGGLLLGGLLF